MAATTRTRPRSRPVSSLRDHAEVAVPGIAIGLLSGAFAPAIALAAGLAPAYALVTGLALGVPLAMLGAGYCLLLAYGKFKIGTVAPMALYFAVGFPLARLMHQFAVAQVSGYDSALTEPLWSFLVFQMLLSFGYTIGFLWLHERFAVRWLMRIHERNPLADSLLDRYSEHASTMVRRNARSRPSRGPRQRGAT